MSNEGKTVSVDYIGTLDDGTEFDSSIKHGQPLTFTCMGGMMIEGFDKAVVNMAIGETKTVRIPPEEAYGAYDETLLEDIPLEQIPNSDQLPVGKTIYVGDMVNPMPVKVVKIENGMVTFDANHPLAGQALNFEITLKSVED